MGLLGIILGEKPRHLALVKRERPRRRYQLKYEGWNFKRGMLSETTLALSSQRSSTYKYHLRYINNYYIIYCTHIYSELTRLADLGGTGGGRFFIDGPRDDGGTAGGARLGGEALYKSSSPSLTCGAGGHELVVGDLGGGFGIGLGRLDSNFEVFCL